MHVVRNALTGFRSHWVSERVKADPSTFDVNSDIAPAQVDRLDYAADGSENDEKESASMSIRKSAKDIELSKVCSTKSNFNKYIYYSFKSQVKIEFRSSRKPAVTIGRTRTSFSNSDLPAGTLKNWQALYLPAWYQYLGTLKDPWSLSEQLPEAQHIWDTVFPNNTQTLAGTGEPIFYLVSSKLSGTSLLYNSFIFV
jgi:hypothetical protein